MVQIVRASGELSYIKRSPRTGLRVGARGRVVVEWCIRLVRLPEQEEHPKNRAL